MDEYIRSVVDPKPVETKIESAPRAAPRSVESYVAEFEDALK
jgi:hypothetical protein